MIITPEKITKCLKQRPKDFFMLLGFCAVFCLLSEHAVLAQSTIQNLDDEEAEINKALVPYAFYNDQFNFALAGAYILSGWPQKQAASVGTGFLSTNGSRAVYLLGRDLQFPLFERLFIDHDISFGRFKEFDIYSDGDPSFPYERAGSNDSDEDNFIEGGGSDHWLRLKFKYLLPIGHGRDTIINTFYLDDGLLASGGTGGEAWNPLKYGRTTFEVRPFYRRQKITSEYRHYTGTTNGLQFALFHDNTDFFADPSEGSEQRFAVSRDWQHLYSDVPWTFIEFEFSKYFSLGETQNFRRRVLAFNLWTGDTPTWDSSDTEDGEEVFHRPPQFAGATLGGVYRMRGYPSSRFNDQAVIYYSAELRLTPEWHPLGNVGWLDFLEIEWWQWVPFVEVGRVAEKWTLNELHTDMKWDVGFGVRAMAQHLVVRIDLAVGDEGGGLQMMVGQPF